MAKKSTAKKPAQPAKKSTKKPVKKLAKKPAQSVKKPAKKLAKKPAQPAKRSPKKPVRTAKVGRGAKRQRPVRGDGPGSAKAKAASKRAAEERRKKSLKAVAVYARALGTLQKRRLSTAAALFRRVIDDFPDERELHERCRRYLEVCNRETTPDPTPETLEERVYAATLALNAGAPDKAIEHLEAAAAKEPDSDHIHYMLAVARAAAGETKRAVTHLERAIELNPDNRFLARNEPSFETLQENAAVRRALSSPPDND